MIQVGEIGFNFSVYYLFQGFHQMFNPFFVLLVQSINHPLLKLSKLIHIQKKRKVPFTMPKNVFLPLPFRNQVFLDPWTPFRKKYMYHFINIQLPQLSVNLNPIGVNLKLHRPKWSSRSLGIRWLALHPLSKILTPWTWYMNFRSIHNESPVRKHFQIQPLSTGIRYPFESASCSALARPMSHDPYDLTAMPAKVMWTVRPSPIPESFYGNVKHNLKFYHNMRIGIKKVRMEMTLMFMLYNIMKVGPILIGNGSLHGESLKWIIVNRR
jgi:hypothetical protein